MTRFRFSRTPTQNGFLACREAVFSVGLREANEINIEPVEVRSTGLFIKLLGIGSFLVSFRRKTETDLIWSVFRVPRSERAVARERPLMKRKTALSRPVKRYCRD